jgi:hypothetical protein
MEELTKQLHGLKAFLSFSMAWITWGLAGQKLNIETGATELRISAIIAIVMFVIYGIFHCVRSIVDKD